MTTPATRRQVGKLHAVFAGLSVTDRDQRLDVLSGVVFRRVESTNDLTFDEASVAINLLDGLDPADTERLARLAERGAPVGDRVKRLWIELSCLLGCAVLLALPVVMVFLEPKSGGN